MMEWLAEPGWENFSTNVDFINLEIEEANRRLSGTDRSLHPKLVDACNQGDFDPKRVLVTNNNITADLLDLSRFQRLPDSFYAIYAGRVSIDAVTPNWNYNCFINRMDVSRQSWLYQLVRRGIFEQGLISFNMDISRHRAQGQALPTDTEFDVFDQQFNTQLQIFKEEHQWIRDRVPYCNFDNIHDAIMDSKFSIILETYFENNDITTFSEKTFRCLKLPRPWLLFSSRGAVNYLRRLGFDVLDGIVDHGYDQIDRDVERQGLILDQAQQLSSLQYTPALYTRLSHAAAHNQDLLMRFLAQFKTDMQGAIYQAEDKARSL